MYNFILVLHLSKSETAADPPSAGGEAGNAPCEPRWGWMKCSCYSYNTVQLTPEHKQSSYPLLSTFIMVLSCRVPQCCNMQETHLAGCWKDDEAEKRCQNLFGTVPANTWLGHVRSCLVSVIATGASSRQTSQMHQWQKPCDAWLIRRICVRSAEHMVSAESIMASRSIQKPQETRSFHGFT